MRIGWGQAVGLTRFAVPGLTRNSSDTWAQLAIAGFLFYAATANIIHGATSLIQTGEWRPLPAEDYFPIKLDSYAPFGISINRNFLAPEIPIVSENGNVRVDNWGPKDAILRALDPVQFIYGRAGQLPRTGYDLIAQQDFYGDPYDQPGEGFLKTFVNLFVPITLDFTNDQERAGERR